MRILSGGLVVGIGLMRRGTLKADRGISNVDPVNNTPFL